MTEGQLDEAMRYGSSRALRDDDLGHFGLGLKTASLSQGRRLTVATRSTRARADPDPSVGPRPRRAHRLVAARADAGPGQPHRADRSARRNDGHRGALGAARPRARGPPARAATPRRADSRRRRRDLRAPRDGVPPVPRRRGPRAPARHHGRWLRARRPGTRSPARSRSRGRCPLSRSRSSTPARDTRSSSSRSCCPPSTTSRAPRRTRRRAVRGAGTGSRACTSTGGTG